MTCRALRAIKYAKEEKYGQETDRAGAPVGGSRRGQGTPAVCLCFLVPILAATAQADDPGVGTWVNAKYDGTWFTPAKIEILPDGRELDYIRILDTAPEWEGRSTSGEQWIDAEGNYWFKGYGIWHDYGTNQNEQKLFVLSKINASRTVLESATSAADYPEELSPVGGQYSIWYKQK